VLICCRRKSSDMNDDDVPLQSSSIHKTPPKRARYRSPLVTRYTNSKGESRVFQMDAFGRNGTPKNMRTVKEGIALELLYDDEEGMPQFLCRRSVR